MGGQRRRALDARRARIGIRDRRQRTGRDEPASHRDGDVDRSAAAADVKVPANVLASDAGKDVAVLFVAPALAASLRPVPLGCEQAAKPTVKEGEES